jgi:hypothetical protein
LVKIEREKPGAPNLIISYITERSAMITNEAAIYTNTVVEELTAAFLSNRIQLTTVAVIIAITIKVKAKPNLPLSGLTPTITKVLSRVKSAPRKSVAKSFGVNFHGCSGLTLRVV